jgi:hypothetical protein
MGLGMVSAISQLRFVLFRFSIRFFVIGGVCMLCYGGGNAGFMIELCLSMFGRFTWTSSLVCVCSQRRPRLRAWWIIH